MNSSITVSIWWCLPRWFNEQTSCKKKMQCPRATKNR